MDRAAVPCTAHAVLLPLIGERASNRGGAFRDAADERARDVQHGISSGGRGASTPSLRLYRTGADTNGLGLRSMAEITGRGDGCK